MTTAGGGAARTAMEQAATLVGEAGAIVVSTGAGMSSESGVRTFRGRDGWWRERRAEELATPEALRRDPRLVWEWYAERLLASRELTPHPGYDALVRLEREGGARTTVVTQNVDGLHSRAGSRDVVELHGSLRSASCLDRCGEAPVTIDGELLSELPPRCPCGSLLRPDVVLFGEPLPEDSLRRAFRLAAKCDVMLVVGTSMLVYPAAALPHLALERSVPVVEVNTDATSITRHPGVVHLLGPAGEVLPELLAEAGI